MMQFIDIIRRFHWHGTDDREKLLSGVFIFLCPAISQAGVTLVTVLS